MWWVYACDDTEVSGTILEGMGWTISPNPAANNTLITMPHGAPSEIRIMRFRTIINPLPLGLNTTP